MATMLDPYGEDSTPVFLVGDNEGSVASFQRTLHGLFPQALLIAKGRSEFRQISDDVVRTSKFIFVMPHAPRQIIYDQSHPTRSFHQEIDRAECGGSPAVPGRDSVFIVVYRGTDPPRNCLIDAGVERLYRAGSQTKLESYATRSRILSFCNSLNSAQISELGLFLRLRPRQSIFSWTWLAENGCYPCWWMRSTWLGAIWGGRLILALSTATVLIVTAVLLIVLLRR